MKRRVLRRKGDTNEKSDEEDNASSCTSPVKDKETLSPQSSREGPFCATQEHKFTALLKDFDHNVAMIIKDLKTENSLLLDNLTPSFLSGLMKLPPHTRNMKWKDYIKKQKASQGECDPATDAATDVVKFAVPSSASSKMETPALRSSSRLAKNKLPVITPKFDPSTCTPLNKRLPKPGEVLVSLKGSPVSIPNPTPFSSRGASGLAASDDKEALLALLKNPDAISNALKDKTTCRAFIKAYNSATSRKE